LGHNSDFLCANIFEKQAVGRQNEGFKQSHYRKQWIKVLGS